MPVERRIHGKPLSVRRNCFEHGQLRWMHGGFATHALAVRWADKDRKAIEKDGDA